MGGVHVLAAGFTDDITSLINGRIKQALENAEISVVADLGSVTDALTAYFDGQVRTLDEIPVQLFGGPFQLRVWEALRQIPPGRPSTYRELAVQLGGPTLARAVGMSNATNLISLIVPCHRLTHGTGYLAGYYWGLDRKRWLLDHEARYSG